MPIGCLHLSQVDVTCVFSLSWQPGQQLSAQSQLPNQLQLHYKHWQTAYLAYYSSSALRGRSGGAGAVSISPSDDTHQKLAKAEAHLLNTFRQWLRGKELYALREQLCQFDTVCISCNSLDLSKLPWEQWQLSAHNTSPVRIVRTSLKMEPQATPSHRQHRIRPRVLVIWGDDTGLDLSLDRQIVNRYRARFNITQLHWSGSETTNPIDIKKQIAAAIADPRGWEILLFFGHSGESAITGGDIQISPELCLSIRDLRCSLETAQANGLQFALFNSCRGLHIAEALIELGLQQCAIMREPIHDKVAQILLDQFLKSLSHGNNVQQALENVRRELETTSHFMTYPSAYLIPSLFHDPNRPFFKLRLSTWQTQLQTLKLQPVQSLLLLILLGLSVFPHAQSSLLSGRLLVQAKYRQMTQQFPTEPPPVTLISIDPESLLNADSPLRAIQAGDRWLRYDIGALLEQLPEQVRTIGLDYIFLPKDRGENLEELPENRELEQIFQSIFDASKTWLVFSSGYSNTSHYEYESNFYDPRQSLYGFINNPTHHLAMPWEDPVCQTDCPLSYMLALAHKANYSPAQVKSRMQNDSILASTAADLKTALMHIVHNETPTSVEKLLQNRLSDMTLWILEYSKRLNLDQYWLQPIFDFSLPPDKIFTAISAQQLLTQETPTIDPNTVVIIAPGGYDNAEDNFSLPPALGYGRQLSDSSIGHYASLPVLTGGEKHAYAVHHFLNQHLVKSIPDIGLLGIAIVMSYGSYRWGRDRILKSRDIVFILIGTNVVYGIVTLQAFVSLQVIVPWLMPALVPWIYWLPSLRRSSMSVHMPD